MALWNRVQQQAAIVGMQAKIEYLASRGIVNPPNSGLNTEDFLKMYYNNPASDPVEATDFQARPPTPTGLGESDVRRAFEESKGGIQTYEQSLDALKNLGIKEDLARGIAGVKYTPFNWQTPDYESVEYTPTEYTFAKDYQAPAEYEAAQYTMPDLEGISSDVWGGQEAAMRERVSQQYDDTRERMREELLRNPARAEQAAALMANVGEQETAAQIAAQRDLAFQRAQSDIGVATTQAQLKMQAEEAQAQEMAKKYGLDVDAARYIVQQQAAQQTAQAGENQYATTYQQGEERYKTGLAQALQEQQAAEAQKVYQAKYGQQQDIAQMKLAQEEANRAAKLDYANALLQGQQARSQQAAQTATYVTNLTEGERGAQKGTADTYAKQQALAKTPTGQVSKTMPTGGNKAITSTTQAGVKNG